jgi:hypothetical protein
MYAWWKKMKQLNKDIEQRERKVTEERFKKQTEHIFKQKK